MNHFSWEILELRHHYHPGLGHLADDLLHLAVRDPYSGDPLNDFSMTKFLDRFAYKNPNKIGKKDDDITLRAKKKSLFGGLNQGSAKYRLICLDSFPSKKAHFCTKICNAYFEIDDFEIKN